jgi:hypothetical protein
MAIYSSQNTRPGDLKPQAPLTEDEQFDEIEDDLYLSPDGTMTTYHAGDEDDPNSEWYGNPPKFKIGNTEFSVTD